MSREKTIEISGINIVTHPHSPDKYLEIIRQINQKPLPVRGHDHLMISGLRPYSGDDWSTGIEGEIVKFSNIDEHAQWVDITSGRLAEDGDVPNLPSHLRPNGALFPFVFHPAKHHLFYISKSRNSSTQKTDTLSPNLVEKLFAGLFASEDISSKFTSINITVIPDQHALSSIFKLPKLTKLFLMISPPNPDDLASVEQAILARLENMNAKKMEQTYYSETGESLVPDEKLKVLAKVASHNGCVQGVGKNPDGKTVSLSTTQQPLREPIKVENNTVAEREALRQFRL